MNDPGATSAPRRRLPASVVALGGGTGLPVVLRGLRALVSSGGVEDLTAVVTMNGGYVNLQTHR